MPKTVPDIVYEDAVFVNELDKFKVGDKVWGIIRKNHSKYGTLQAIRIDNSKRNRFLVKPYREKGFWVSKIEPSVTVTVVSTKPAGKTGGVKKSFGNIVAGGANFSATSGGIASSHEHPLGVPRFGF